MLFLPVDRDSKYDGKMAIDSFFWRFGDLVQAVGIYVGLNVFGWTSHSFALLNLLLSLVWIWLSWVVGRDYTRKAKVNMTSVAPVAKEAIPDLLFSPGKPFAHPISPTSFHHDEPGDVIMLRARCHDGRRLPRWIRFQAHEWTFIGHAPHDLAITELRIVVIASNLDGLEARSTFSAKRHPA
jgi:AAA family ATP:ADP antiporter